MNASARIARRNVRITFQKNAVAPDAYMNRVRTWTDYFTCFAYASTFNEQESGNEVTYEERQVTFECRYCPELAPVTSTGYRILFTDGRRFRYSIKGETVCVGDLKITRDEVRDAFSKVIQLQKKEGCVCRSEQLGCRGAEELLAIFLRIGACRIKI